MYLKKGMMNLAKQAVCLVFLVIHDSGIEHSIMLSSVLCAVQSGNAFLNCWI